MNTRKIVSFTQKPLNLFFLMCALVMSMSGCSTTAQSRPNVPYQENLLTRCPVQFPRLAGNTGQDFDQALRAYRTLYSECAARHNQLITDINQRREIEQ
ncbi:hypothetical protein OA04_13850 [Pectobacterium versatile]|nr:hypothetical protein OA04_13850 [Pectobacterium versatile]